LGLASKHMIEDNNRKGKKWRPLERMFNEVPGRYDLLNRVITLRLDERWRKLAVRECLSGNPEHALDLCTGTGDLVLRMAKNANGIESIQALDYSKPMLEVARKKAQKRSIHRIDFIHGDAAEMPFADNSLDSIGIGFAFRNLTYKNRDREKFLTEIYRVLKSNGKFVIIESSQPSNAIVRSLFRLYLKLMVAGVGGLISGHRSAYRYLAASARNFYSPNEVQKMLLDTGFNHVQHRSLSGGIAGLTTAIK
jgi:demethylmenaquinone methyltransferase/2-methoxy-6-polyprenyl-1,4-benzoquinol methylase